VDGAEINGVLGRELLLQVKAKFPLFKIVVRPLPGIRSVERLKQVTAVLKGPKLRAVLDPGAPAQILRARGHAQAIAFEQL